MHEEGTMQTSRDQQAAMKNISDREAQMMVHKLRPTQNAFLDFIVDAAPTLNQIGIVRHAAANRFRRILRQAAEREIAEGHRTPGVIHDRRDMGLAIVDTVERTLAEDRLSPATVDRFMNVLVKDVLIHKGDRATKAAFKDQHGSAPPAFIVISPGKGCNLRCVGCYAASDHENINLPWPVFERLVDQVRDLWGSRFIVLSGGEPLVYRDEGKGILEMAAAHPEMFFMFYTNGTLITDAVAAQMAEMGNIMPAVSVEGMREQTDARRGKGIFDKVLAAMASLREHKVAFGISMTATRYNADMLLSDRVIDYFFGAQGAIFGWLFHYMPIGRDFTLDLMPTPAQRHQLWAQAWHHIRTRGIFLADFWNGGTIVHGCLSAGRSRGYFYVDWNGNLSPCVFVPYAPLNVNQLFAENKTLNDAWTHPFFADLRRWQHNYGFDEDGMRNGCRNWLMPCPIRDHHGEFRAMLNAHEPEPMDDNAAAALQDQGYYDGMVAFDRDLAREMDPIWEMRYQDGRLDVPDDMLTGR